MLRRITKSRKPLLAIICPDLNKYFTIRPFDGHTTSPVNASTTG